MAERCVDLGIGDSRQALLRRPAGRNRGQALLDVASVGVQVRFASASAAPACAGQVTSAFEVVGQAF